MKDTGYIYIGQYFHKRGKDLSNLTEKKIGKSSNPPDRENALNSTKFTIGYTMVKVWAVENMSQIEKALHSILPNRLDGEWFEDEDDTLIDRITKFMTHIGGVEQPTDLSKLDMVEQQAIKSTNSKIGNRNRVGDLAGQKFTYCREDIPVTIEITSQGKFKNLETGIEYDAPTAPFWRSWDGKITGSTSINGWKQPKNDQGRSIDAELAILP
jgi:hypothetical protein